MILFNLGNRSSSNLLVSDPLLLTQNHAPSRIDRLQGRLLTTAGVFLLLNALALTISPYVNAPSGQAIPLWGHWFGYAAWLVGFLGIHHTSKKFLPQRDPYLIPIIGLFSGWGLLTIWRLYPDLGLRQSIWMLIAITIFILGIRLYPHTFLIRKYKYTWLTASLILTASTFVWGTNPMGYGPEMWLGCCGVYLQPSEPLKFMLVAYLAAFLADQQPFLLLAFLKPEKGETKNQKSSRSTSLTGLLPLLTPTLIMSGMALLLLIIQRDLGTATIFLLLYAVIVYVATANLKVIWFSLALFILAFVGGIRLFDIVQVRVEAWLNPFLDPSGDSYQIVQALISLANGELFGRGFGIGYPYLVPVAHSDFIFTSIVEESGLLGGLAMVFCLVVFFFRCVRNALRTADPYRRYLGIGLTAYLVGQSLLIIGGNLRLFPLTGITLPFISYGGSSLVVSFLSALFLVLIGENTDEPAAPVLEPGVYRNLGTVFLGVLFAAGILVGWWTLFRSPELLNRTDNPRRSISDTIVRRGSIVDRQNYPINESNGLSGNYLRELNVPALSNILGYTNPTYGQSGLEASMDGYLRGVEGNPDSLIWWHRLLYGLPPPGRDVRTSLDLDLQNEMDVLLTPYKGAAILINANTGEILAMSSVPTFDGNQLNELWNELIDNPDAPLVNRVIQGRYPVGELSNGIFRQYLESGEINPNPLMRLPVEQLNESQAATGFASPVQIVLASAAFSNRGIQPAPLLVTAVNIEPQGWVIFPPVDKPRQLVPEDQAKQINEDYRLPELGIWQTSLVVPKPAGGSVTWYVGGTATGWEGSPYAITVLLEVENLAGVTEIGQKLLLKAMQP